MRSSRAVVALLLLLGASVVCFAQSGDAAGSETPVLTVENDQLMLGNITAGEDAVGTFVFHNHGDTAIKIIRAKPS